MVSGEMSLRLRCRFFGQGSGNRIMSRETPLSGSQPSTSRASPSRTLIVLALLGSPRPAAVMAPKRLDPPRLDRTEQAPHPVDERLAADESDIYVVPCLKKEMLARAESYFEPNRSDWHREEVLQTLRSRGLEVEFKLRQEVGNEALFPSAQGLGLAPAIGPERLNLGGRTCLRRQFTHHCHARAGGHPVTTGLR